MGLGLGAAGLDQAAAGRSVFIAARLSTRKKALKVIHQ